MGKKKSAVKRKHRKMMQARQANRNAIALAQAEKRLGRPLSSSETVDVLMDVVPKSKELQEMLALGDPAELIRQML